MIIKHPMDISTCKKKLKLGKYSTFEKFNKDLLQIWENCRIYNQAGSLIVQQADAMEEHHKKFLEANPLPVNIPQRRPREESDHEFFTFEAKVILAEKIRKASTDTLAKIYTAIENNSKSAIEKFPDYIRLKIDKLDPGSIETINQ